MTRSSCLYVSSFLFLFFLFASCTKGKETEYQKINLSEGWTIYPSDRVKNPGNVVSSSDQLVSGWYNAIVPSTVMGTLTRNGLYKDVLYSKNIKDVDKSQFNSSWWYRTEFDLTTLKESQHVLLNFDGLTYSANIWLNGQLIASRDSVYGPFRRFSFDITGVVAEKNILAVEIFRAQAGDPNIGFVDWNPRPSDENMGIFREVSVITTGDVYMSNAYVQPKVNTETLDEAWLTVQADVENLSENAVTGSLTGKIEAYEFSQPVTLASKEKKRITITPADFSGLHIKNPRLWWCNNLGSPELYDLDLKFVENNTISSQENVTFGIRQIDTYMTERGDKGFILNGKKVLIKGAGWTDDIFLRDTPETNEIQVKYVKDMNMNMIRFENIWGTSSNIYDLCDKYGLLALVGWSCHWEWEGYFGKPCDDQFGCIQTEEEMNLIAGSFEDQILWLRNHPAIIAWFVGSDMLPKPELEKKYMDILKEVDNRPYIGAAKSMTSEITGATGMKMAGPYEYVGPNYWYIDTIYGGAFGFNTETGIGAQLPVRESIEKMLPADKLWPINDEWSYHCTTSTSAMNSLDVLTGVINHKYGTAKGLDDYLMKADLVNYDGTRAMFEAFRVNMPKTTGITQWMLNSAWPSMYWQLYDYFYIPTAAYYSVKKANMPGQLIYNYGDKAVYAVNERLESLNGVTALIEVYSMDSKQLSRNRIEISVGANTSQKVIDLPKVDENTFLFLRLLDKDEKQIADNYYVLSAKQDEYLWKETNWVHTPMSSYENFESLSDISSVDIGCTVEATKTGKQTEITVQLDNPTANIAFFMNLKLKDNNGEMIYPAFWSDNYVSMLPKEKMTLKCIIDKKVTSESINLVLTGWNTPVKEINNINITVKK